MDQTIIDSLWILVCVTLVFVMQAGFLCLETGLTRNKDAINVALKNLTDFSVSFILFWVFGFAFVFGDSFLGLIGTNGFLLSAAEKDPSIITKFLFHAMFCAAAATIVSGAVAGRMKFGAYIIATLTVSGVIYPIAGHWAWGGTPDGTMGWLSAMGFVDFAGSTVVHSVGGWSALAAILIIGPRLGRFSDSKGQKEIPGSNLPLAMLGTLLLWMGWIGFNGGSSLELNHAVPRIIATTMLAGVAGMLTATFLGWILKGVPEPSMAINGSLAGLVSITAGCHAIELPDAVLVGIVGAIVMILVLMLLEKFKIDDAVGAVPVHLAGGIWGTIAVALFGDLNELATGLTRWEQLAAQLTGIGMIGLATFAIAYSTLRVANFFYPLRVTVEEERMGLNVAEHGAYSELHHLLSEMDLQRQTGDFTQGVTVDPNSEIGKIAEQYNRVLAVINSERKQLLRSNQWKEVANAELVIAKRSIESKLKDLANFNEVAVGREIRMIELKQEINDICESSGLPERYDVEFKELELEQPT